MRIKFILVFLTLVFTTIGYGYDFDADLWELDSNRVLHIAHTARALRVDLRSFAIDHVLDTEIRCDAHKFAEKTIVSYAVMAQELAAIEGRWANALPPRLRLSDGIDNRIKGTTLANAAVAVYLENASCLVNSFRGTIYENRFNEQTVDSSRVTMEWLFMNMASDLSLKKRRDEIEKRIEYLTFHKSRQQSLCEDETVLFPLIKLIADSTEIHNGNHQSSFKRWRNEKAEDFRRIKKRTKNAAYKITGNISRKLFEAVGNKDFKDLPVEAKKLDRVRSEMLELLEPGDLILQKYGHSGPRFLYPSYFSHVAIWAGQADEIEAMGLFDEAANPDSYENAQKYRSLIMGGNTIFEALYTGIQPRDIDSRERLSQELAIIRFKGKPGKSIENRNQSIRDSIFNAALHLGQVYDFSFDCNSYNTVVCSELVFQCFPSWVHFPVTKRLGRPTVSPDNIATLAGPSEDFAFEVIYYNKNGESYGGSESWKAYWNALGPLADMPDKKDPRNASLRAAIKKLRCSLHTIESNNDQ